MLLWELIHLCFYPHYLCILFTEPMYQWGCEKTAVTDIDEWQMFRNAEKQVRWVHVGLIIDWKYMITFLAALWLQTPTLRLMDAVCSTCSLFRKYHHGLKKLTYSTKIWESKKVYLPLWNIRENKQALIKDRGKKLPFLFRTV